MSDVCATPIRSNPAHCPVDGTKGKAVARTTLEHLLKPEAKVRLGDGPHYFCSVPACPVVYFGPGLDQVFLTQDVAVPVWQKDTGEDVPACYCFNHTRRSIVDEIRRTGKSTVQASIAAKVKAEECACTITNPQGSCCLGNVSQVVKEGMKQFGRESLSSSIEKEHGCCETENQDTQAAAIDARVCGTPDSQALCTPVQSRAELLQFISSSQPTPHAVHTTDGQILHVLCALDTLVYPLLTSQNVSVACLTPDGALVAFAVTDGEVRGPRDVVISIPAFFGNDVEEVVATFCPYSHAFPNEAAFERWQAGVNVRTQLLSLHSAMELARRLVENLPVGDRPLSDHPKGSGQGSLIPERVEALPRTGT